MPTYEYRCAKGHEFEVFQRMSEAPVDKCIHCGAQAERLLSAGAGLLFKGSGFYITDYRSDTYRKAAEADTGGGSAKTADAPKSSEGSKGGTATPPPSSGSSSSSGSSGSE